MNPGYVINPTFLRFWSHYCTMRQGINVTVHILAQEKKEKKEMNKRFTEKARHRDGTFRLLWRTKVLFRSVSVEHHKRDIQQHP